MGSKAPESPPPPDMAKANREGIQMDIDTLPLRRQVEQASALGQGAVFNGKYYSNAADAYAAKQANDALVAQSEAEGKGLNAIKEQILDAREMARLNFRNGDRENYTAIADALEAKLKTGAAGNPLAGEVGDFTGLGDDVLSRKYLDIALDGADELARRQLAMRKEIGIENVKQTLAELKASDPEGYAAREKIQREVERSVTGYDENAGDLGKILKDARDDYALGSKLDASTANEVEQAARAAQSARGNILGIGAAAQEAMALGSAGEQRRMMRREALGAVDSANYGRKQQNLANASSFLLGNPITNQFGSLAGAQSGALNYQPQNPTKGIGQDAGAGARSQGYAQQNYSQAMDAYNKEASKGNPWMNIASGAIGAGVGAFTGGLGGGLASSMFSAAANPKKAS